MLRLVESYVPAIILIFIESYSNSSSSFTVHVKVPYCPL
uniref:Uncharacterized protein n=1 Tax=virus sp. ctE0n6 TaxID=2827985 RepID=A0A8S5RF34_9VIRU|nr:MAG TPA: hypothetical protein [virus sp. ctE0n6]